MDFHNQGLITLVDADRKVVVKYSYHSIGKLLNIKISLADIVRMNNAFIY
ncbi:MAG: hypothetical protein Q4D16_14035 [Eubacteriales bacterium]|nr:hypothetical protein [Eubacteriales bacterium]